jgi:hypothetical protein
VSPSLIEVSPKCEWTWMTKANGFCTSVGIAKANEVLIWSKRKTAHELLECGFLKCVFFFFLIPES